MSDPSLSTQNVSLLFWLCFWRTKFHQSLRFHWSQAWLHLSKWCLWYFQCHNWWFWQSKMVLYYQWITYHKQTTSSVWDWQQPMVHLLFDLKTNQCFLRKQSQRVCWITLWNSICHLLRLFVSWWKWWSFYHFSIHFWLDQKLSHFCQLSMNQDWNLFLQCKSESSHQ